MANDVELIIERCKAHGLSLQQAAYVLATVQHETNGTYVPVKEAYWLSEAWRKNHLRYYPWFGRGYVQLTWKANYQKAANYFKRPELMSNPDLMITDKNLSANVMIIGMMHGWFGQPLTRYVGGKAYDYYNARRSVNILDKADLVATYAREWEKGLKERGYTLATKEPEREDTTNNN